MSMTSDNVCVCVYMCKFVCVYVCVYVRARVCVCVREGEREKFML